jgi:lysozyme
MRDALLKDLVRDEGVRLKPYKCPAGKLTIGVGRNIEDIGITAEEAHTLLSNDVDRVFGELDRSLSWWRGRPDHVQRGLANMAFQMGLSGLLGFKRMLAALQAGDYATARKEAMDSAWYTQTPARAERVIALFSEKEPTHG